MNVTVRQEHFLESGRIYIQYDINYIKKKPHENTIFKTKCFHQIETKPILWIAYIRPDAKDHFCFLDAMLFTAVLIVPLDSS